MRLCATIWAACLAALIAKVAGRPFWGGWDAGDQCDFAFFAALFVWYLIGALREKQG
jgi:hypothetical protein